MKFPIENPSTFPASQPKPKQSPLLSVGRAIIGGILIGGVIAIAGQFVYLIILFPLIMGGFGGLIALSTVSRVGIQRRWVVILIGVASGLLVYGSYRYIDYLLVIRQMKIAISFFEYVRLVAKFGTSVGPATSSLQLPLNETFTWGYWIFEIILVIGLSAYLAPIGLTKSSPKTETA